MSHAEILARLGIEEVNPGVFAGEWVDPSGRETIDSISPGDGSVLAKIAVATEEDVERTVRASAEAFLAWRELPAPRRGLVLRDCADALRGAKDDLGALITLEMGKIRAEGVGEVQEAIDIADFSVGLSRQLYGLAMHSERPEHRMYEQWHPLGIVGIVTAFNFPVAVWSWNSMIAAACGDTMIWKPSSKTPLTAIATTRLVAEVFRDHGHPAVMNLLVGSGRVVGEKLLEDRRLPLISATGSCRMGRHLAQVVGNRLGRTLLELGGNNALIVMDDADLDLALRAVLFGAVGTAGQRCTTTRRLILQKGIAKGFLDRLLDAYGQIRIGDPMDPSTVMGPLVDGTAVEDYRNALVTIREQGGEVLAGGKVLEGGAYGSGCYVTPTIVRAKKDLPIMQEEVFVPILYVVEVEDLDEAIAVQNGVDQGLSSAIFTDSVRSAEAFLSARGSDCGIANVNIGTSGAEIGGAFGGEKDTGGGREAGSDSWKVYMRRQTTTINWGRDLPLAQGIRFG